VAVPNFCLESRQKFGTVTPNSSKCCVPVYLYCACLGCTTLPPGGCLLAQNWLRPHQLQHFSQLHPPSPLQGPQQARAAGPQLARSPSVAALSPRAAAPSGTVPQRGGTRTGRRAGGGAHASRVTRHASRVTPHASRLTPHASRLTRHASRVTPHASRLTRHASRLTPHALLMATAPCAVPAAHCRPAPRVPLQQLPLSTQALALWSAQCLPSASELEQQQQGGDRPRGASPSRRGWGRLGRRLGGAGTPGCSRVTLELSRPLGEAPACCQAQPPSW